jgi:hypothetical protein
MHQKTDVWRSCNLTIYNTQSTCTQEFFFTFWARLVSFGDKLSISQVNHLCFVVCMMEAWKQIGQVDNITKMFIQKIYNSHQRAFGNPPLPPGGCEDVVVQTRKNPDGSLASMILVNVMCDKVWKTVCTLYPEKHAVRLAGKNEHTMQKWEDIQMMQHLATSIQNLHKEIEQKSGEIVDNRAWTTEDKQNIPNALKSRIQLLMKGINITKGGTWSLSTKSGTNIMQPPQIHLKVFHENVLKFTFMPRQNKVRAEGDNENTDTISITGPMDVLTLSEICKCVDARYGYVRVSTSKCVVPKDDD